MSENVQLYYTDAEIVRDLVDEALEACVYHGNPEVYSRETVLRIKNLANILGEMEAQIRIAREEDESWEEVAYPHGQLNSQAKGEDQ